MPNALAMPLSNDNELLRFVLRVHGAFPKCVEVLMLLYANFLAFRTLHKASSRKSRASKNSCSDKRTIRSRCVIV